MGAVIPAHTLPSVRPLVVNTLVMSAPVIMKIPLTNRHDQPGYKAVQVIEHGVHFRHAGGKGTDGKRVRAPRLCRDSGTAHKDHYDGEDRQKFLGFQKN